MYFFTIQEESEYNDQGTVLKHKNDIRIMYVLSWLQQVMAEHKTNEQNPTHNQEIFAPHPASLPTITFQN